MKLDQAGATLAEAAVIFGLTAQAGTILRAEQAEAGSAGLAPTQYGGGMEQPLRGGAVAGRLAAAGLQFVDGTFQQLAKGKDLLDEALVVLEKTEEDAPLATGLIEAKSQRSSPSLC